MPNEFRSRQKTHSMTTRRDTKRVEEEASKKLETHFQGETDELDDLNYERVSSSRQIHVVVKESVKNVEDDLERKSRKTSQKKVPSKSVAKWKYGTSNFQFVIVPIVLLLGIVLCPKIYRFFRGASKEPVEVLEEYVEKLNELLERAKKDFEDQSDFTWKVLNKTLTRFVEKVALNSSSKPITMLMLGTDNDRSCVNCLSKVILNDVTSVITEKNCEVIKTNNLVSEDEDSLKIALEKQISTTFDKPCHAIVVEDIDKMAYPGLITLQPYSDDTSSHLNVILMLTATTNSSFPSSEGLRTFSEVARNHLEEAWRDIHDDYRAAFLSRFMENVVVVKPGYGPRNCL